MEVPGIVLMSDNYDHRDHNVELPETLWRKVKKAGGYDLHYYDRRLAREFAANVERVMCGSKAQVIEEPSRAGTTIPVWRERPPVDASKAKLTAKEAKKVAEVLRLFRVGAVNVRACKQVEVDDPR